MIRPVVWAKMEGIVFGATKKDAHSFSKNLQNKKFTWRQINISSRYIIRKSNSKIKLVKNFMRQECYQLFSFAKNN